MYVRILYANLFLFCRSISSVAHTREQGGQTFCVRGQGQIFYYDKRDVNDEQCCDSRPPRERTEGIPFAQVERESRTHSRPYLTAGEGFPS